MSSQGVNGRRTPGRRMNGRRMNGRCGGGRGAVGQVVHAQGIESKVATMGSRVGLDAAVAAWSADGPGVRRC